MGARQLHGFLEYQNAGDGVHTFVGELELLCDSRCILELASLYEIYLYVSWSTRPRRTTAPRPGAQSWVKFDSIRIGAIFYVCCRVRRRGDKVRHEDQPRCMDEGREVSILTSSDKDHS
jgi:hypothetical protein